jgi:putative DNA primase/helicase
MQFTAPYSLVGGGNLGLHLHPEHLADLQASGLSDHTIKSAGVYSLAPSLMSHFFSARKGVPSEVKTALCFPYQGRDFARIKLFPPAGKMKYAQPPKSGACLYVPFRVADGPVYVCEGEKKTLTGWQHGLNAVGIGGVWNWLSHGEPIDDLKLVHWDGRDITIIPDSDVFNRADLLRAVYALGQALQSQGATVYVARIPQTGPAKVGLDDFLVASGVIDRLEVFALSHKIFKGCQYWHGTWKFKQALEAA